MKEVAGRTAFITGGGSGVGLGIANAFARAGMNIVVADIRRDHLDDAMKSLAGFPVHAVETDVSDRASVARAADEAERIFGPLHVVCNNAGVNMFAPMDECTYQDWDWILGVNLGGVVNGIRTFVPRMKAHGQGGHVVNTASMAAFITGPAAGIYTTSKFAVRGLSESLRWALAPHGIGVSVLCPGLVKSQIYESEHIRPAHLATDIGPVDAEFMACLPEIHDLGMTPEEVGEKVLAGVRANALYIFPHPEFKDELREIFSDVLDAFPDEEPEPKRLEFEEHRRRLKAEAAR